MTTLVSDEIEEYAIWEGRISEMWTDTPTSHTDLRIPEDFMTRVKASDENPLFVTVEIEAGQSRSKRNWKPEHLQQVIDKVNNGRMAGNLGHPLLKPGEHESAFPEPQVVWAAAKMVSTNTAAFKGYVLKSAKARGYLELGLIDGVSIFGDSRMKPTRDGYDVISFDPETIDFARKGQSGMKSRVVALTGEQASRGGVVEPKDIAALAPDEVKTHAPLVYKAIQDEVSAPLNEKVGEMEATIGTLKPEVDIFGEIKKLLKLTDGENPVEKVTNLLKQIEDVSTADVKAYIREVVGKKVKTERGQALVMRLIGEMSADYDGMEFNDELKTKIEADVTKKMDEDDNVKTLVGEMAGRSREDDNGREGQGGSQLGGRSRLGADRGREGSENGVVSENDNVRVRKVKVGG